MRPIFHVLMLALAVPGGVAHAQASAAAQGSVTIVDPPQVGQASELSVAPIIRPSGARSVTAEAAQGRYTVGGRAGDTFNLAVPSTMKLVRSGGTDEVLLTLTPPAGVTTLSGAYGAPALGEFGVGGKLGVSGATTPGLYQGSVAVILSLQ